MIFAKLVLLINVCQRYVSDWNQCSLSIRSSLVQNLLGLGRMELLITSQSVIFKNHALLNTTF